MDDFYKLEQADGMVIYTQILNSFGDFYFTFYYFSKDLDSPIFKLTRKNLEREFGDNPCFIAELNKDIKWYEDYTAVDRKKTFLNLLKYTGIVSTNN